MKIKKIKAKMSKIIIFKEIQEKALDNSLDDLVLFGERDFIDNSSGKYDLIFHSKQCYPYDKEKPCSLVIPVLRTTGYNENMEDIVKEAYNENPNPDFTTYAVVSEFLDFYELILDKNNSNPLTVGLGKYKCSSEKKFMKILKNPHIFMRQLQEKRRIIDKKY